MSKKYFMITEGNKDDDEVKDTSFLYIKSPNSAGSYLENLYESDITRNSLPRRILVSGPKPDGNIWNNLPILYIDNDLLSKNDLKTREEEETFILDIYDRWIQYLIDRQKICRPTLSIFFEDPEKARQWEDSDIKADWASDLEFPCKITEDKEIEDNLCAINVWRHRELSRILPYGDPLYYEFTSFHNPFFSFLYSILPKDTQFIAKYAIRQIAESALLRILIVDDRIASTLWRKEDGNAKIKELSYMGIWVAKKLTIGNDTDPVWKILNDEDDKCSKGLIDIVWKKNGDLTPSCQSLDIKKPCGFDMLFMHQTIFDDKIPEPAVKIQNWKEQWIFDTKRNIPYIIFHSGRGRQKDKLPKNVPFLEYSVLQQYVLQEPSKFFLSLLGMSAKETQENGR